MQSVQKVTPTMGQKEKIGKQERMKKKKKKQYPNPKQEHR